MTTITWAVTAMDCYPQEGGNTNVKLITQI